MPQKHQTPCRVRKKPVSLQHHYIANNMEYLKRTADEHLSLLHEPDLLMVITGREMAHSSGWCQNHSAGLLEGQTCDAVNPNLSNHIYILSKLNCRTKSFDKRTILFISLLLIKRAFSEMRWNSPSLPIFHSCT